MKVVNTLMRVGLVASVTYLSVMLGYRLATLPDTQQLATKSDIRAVQSVAITRFDEESRKRQELAVEEDRRHRQVKNLIEIAMKRQRHVMRQQDDIEKKLRKVEHQNR